MIKSLINLAVLLNCLNACSQIIDIEDMNGTRINGAYYKDINNLLDPYVGTWVYSSPTDTLKIKLRKVINTPFINNSFEDLIVGEYQYIKNGVEKINTLANFNTDYPMQIAHKIDGNSILENYNIPMCNYCNPNEKRLQLSLTEPISLWSADLNLRLISVNGQPALEVFKWGTPPPARIEGDPTTGYANPIIEIDSNFIMIKQ
ncbi:MAG TPA: DUF6705 family protein [Flavobacterium sp.]|uniref:DUF6705 family protein n=1 Tax=Flavobacterium sp. TaxID=239 RepID=UPI002B4B2E09|nr:DUF6705 family protein [Flavobacterium sp.]HLO72804.1 DUF6705 family protein [Flavobacterium sp.]